MPACRYGLCDDPGGQARLWGDKYRNFEGDECQWWKPDGLGWWQGVVTEFHARDPGNQEEDLYTVLYSDGEEEDYTLSELCPILKGPEQEGRGGRG